uniref:Reverse transcriptase domain-containing protein n=1 Tax=Tanacetum cinerariifolium TaxID=118510 RepID=A0A6L2NQS1_TANCI|nr:reverse transcriptase domain-containing protein [Tanacetum cinerariifolium]
MSRLQEEVPVAEALAAHKANLNIEIIVEGGDEKDNSNGGGNGNGNGNEGGNRNWNGNNNNRSHGEDTGRARQAAHECTYKEFLNYQPLNFKGTKGAVGLARWFEKMESVFHILETDATYTMACKELMKLMTEFQEISLVCPNMVPEKEDKVERQGHYCSDCLKLKNQNRGYQAGNNKAQGKAFALGAGEANEDSNVVTRTFLLTNRYATMLFDSRSDRSFVSTTFSILIDVVLTALDVSYAIKLGDERVIGSNTINRGCTLNLLNHPLNIYLMPVEHGSFNIIIGMDWLSKYHVVIIYDEKIVRIPYGNEVLIIQGDRSNSGSNLRLSIISCTKTQKYIKKGCHVILAQITEKKTEDKSEEK